MTNERRLRKMGKTETIVKRLLNSGGGKYVLIPTSWLLPMTDSVELTISDDKIVIKRISPKKG